MVYSKQTDGNHPCEEHSQGVINCLEKDTGRSCHNWTRILCEIELRIYPNQTLLLLLFRLTLCDPWTAARQASLSFTISQSLLKLMSIALVIPSNYLILCLPFSSCPQSFPTSGSFPQNQLFASDRPINTIGEGIDSQDLQNELSHLF